MKQAKWGGGGGGEEEEEVEEEDKDATTTVSDTVIVIAINECQHHRDCLSLWKVATTTHNYNCWEMGAMITLQSRRSYSSKYVLCDGVAVMYRYVCLHVYIYIYRNVVRGCNRVGNIDMYVACPQLTIREIEGYCSTIPIVRTNNDAYFRIESSRA